MTDFSKLAEFTLDAGAHYDPSEGLCAMEAVAWLEGMEHTDRPSCTDEGIGNYVRFMNDVLDHKARQRLISYLPRLVGTVTDDPLVLLERRNYLLKRVVNVHLPENFSVFKEDMTTAIGVFSKFDPTNPDEVKEAGDFLAADIGKGNELTLVRLRLVSIFNMLSGLGLWEPVALLNYGGSGYSDDTLFETLDGLLAIGQQSQGFSRNIEERVDAYEALLAAI